MAAGYGEWSQKGATFNEAKARAEYGLTEEEIDTAIRAGKLEYRVGSVHGNPWIRLLRREVENLVKELKGEVYLMQKQAKTELPRIEEELKRLRADVAELEERKSALLAALSG